MKVLNQPFFRQNTNLFITVAAMVSIFIIDMSVPLGIAVGVLYIVPILWMRREAVTNKIIAISALSAILVIAGIYVSGGTDYVWKAYVNRLITLFLIIVTTYSVVYNRVSEKEFEFGSEDRKNKPLFLVLSILGALLFLLWLFGTIKNLETSFKNQTLQEATDVMEASEDMVENVWINNLFANTRERIRESKIADDVIKIINLKNDREALLKSQELKNIRTYFDYFIESNELRGISVISPDGVTLVSMRDDKIGTKNVIFKYAPERLQQVFSGKEQVAPITQTDIALREQNGRVIPNYPAIFLLFPLHDIKGRTIAAFSIRLDPNLKLNSIMNMHHFGNSGVSYVFNKEGKVFSLRNAAESQDGKKTLANVLNRYKEVKQGHELEAYDFSGRRVLRAWKWNERLGMGFVSEIDEDEALERFHEIQIYILGGLLGSLVLIGSVLFFGSRFRRRIQQKLEYSEKFLRSVLNNASDAILTYDQDNRILSMNQKVSELLGYETDELIGRDIALLIRNLNNHDEDSTYESEIRHKDAHAIPVRIGIGKMLINQETFYSVILHDLSEYKASQGKLEEMVIERTAQLEEVHRLGKIGNWRWEIAENKVIWSAETYKIFGVNPEDSEPTYDVFLSAIHEDDREAVNKEVGSALEKPDVNYFIQHRVIDKGEIRYVEERGYAVWNADGVPIRMIGTVQDVTERIYQERAIKDAEERLRQILESAAEGIYGLDQNGITTFVNPSAAAMLGYTVEELLGKPMHDTVHHSYPDHTHYPKEKCPMYATVVDGEVHHIQNEVLWKKDGTPLSVEYTSIPMYHENQLEGAVVTFFDRSERDKYEESLKNEKLKAEKSNQAKSTFMANMSHEIRTPMNAILGYTQLIQRSADTSSETKRYLDIVLKSGKHLLDLINDILDMSKIEAGGVEVNNKPVDLHTLLEEIELMFHIRAVEKNLQFHIAFEPDLVQFIEADEQKMRQVLINLIGNAIKFTDRGFVTVNVTHHLDDSLERTVMLNFQVNDSGTAIPQEDRQKIFEPFKQSKAGMNHKGGTGLGLAISREYARLMGGDIVMQESDEGNLFFFTMHAAESSGYEVLKKDSLKSVIGIQGDSTDKTILVVDDNANNRELLKAALGDIGFRVIEAENGEEAISIFEQEKPAIILMDIRMPVMNGIEATQKIRETAEGKKAIIIIVSATTVEYDMSEITQLANAFIRKPIHLDHLFDVIGKEAGIEFLYKDEEAKEDRRINENRPLSELLAPEVQKEFLEIAKIGNIEKLKEAINAVSDIDMNAKQMLFDKIEAFDINGLLNLLNS